MGKNYKNMTFNDNMQGFKAWCKEFPPLDKDAVKHQAFQKKDGYYLELQLVKDFLGADPFVHANIRAYDEENRNFECISTEKEKELLESIFRDKVRNFETRWK